MKKLGLILFGCCILALGQQVQSGGGILSSITSLAASSFISLGSSPAASGSVRLSSTNSVTARNNAGSGDLGLLDTTAADIMRIGYSGIASIASSVTFGAPLYTTTTNCSSSAAPAVCAAAAAGSVVVAASATTVVVNTTAVTANSQIFVMYDSSLGTKLSVTCNTTEPALYGVTARTGGTSFTITSSAPTTNPACFSYHIIN